MKKKFLSFIMAICLILPCAFALSACDKNPESGGPVDLAGKTIVVQYGAELDWNVNKITIAAFEEVNDNDGSYTVAYSTELTLEEFVEQFYESNPDFIKGIAGNSNINNVEEAKNSIEIRMGGEEYFRVILLLSFQKMEQLLLPMLEMIQILKLH